MGRRQRRPRKATRGLFFRNGIWHIDKRIRGRRLCESTGEITLEKAEEYLARRTEQIRHVAIYGERPKRTWRQAATRYLNENQRKASIDDDAMYLKQLDSFIGGLHLEQVHMGTLMPFIEARRKAGVKTRTVNLALGCARHILNVAASEWLDEHGLTWLHAAPKIKLLRETDARKAYPLGWDEQRYLLQALPDYLAKMALFKLNTGTREQEVCQLQWDWEIKVPELDTSVFLIPGQVVKNREDRLVVLNRVAASVVEEQRGKDAKYVFVSKGKPLRNMNDTSWQRGRLQAALRMARESEECEYIRVESTGRYLSLVWSITAKRVGASKPVSMSYSVDDFDAERRAKGLAPIRGSARKEYDLKQLMRFKALQRFFARHWPEVEAFSRVRVHDLKHTFGRRLRAAGVSFEDRQDLLGHKSCRITTHYSAAELESLIAAAERVCGQNSRKIPALVVLKRKSG